ncbi:MAG: EAL domain-containing protein, partial [Pseudoxanthomonas sp.]|nr:EAL domain-containing protein [Pseudoxanthomonas sp.]
MKLRFGLQARFLVVMAAMLGVVLLVLLLLLQRQEQMRHEAETLTREGVHDLVETYLRDRAQAMARQLAENLANPMYYRDLDAIGRILADNLHDSLVAHIHVYDLDDRLVHDGSDAIAGYGQPMADALVAGPGGVAIRTSPTLLEASAPISVGGEEIGAVRLGLDLQVAARYQADSLAHLRERMDQLGSRYLRWLVLPLALLLLACVLAAWYVQRTLVRPIRALADSARRIEGGDYKVEHLHSKRTDEVGNLVRAFGRMGESVARHDREVRRMAYTDALTGLTNRLAFRESLDHRLMLMRGSDRQLALLFADIDDFKRVNDTLGHEAGDEALLQFASRIQQAVDRYGGDDALLARFGGDEFVVLIQEGDVRQAATRLAEVLVAELRLPLDIQGRQVFLGTSIGITLFPEDASSASALMKNGDIAMYQAKVAGKNDFRFYSRAMDHAVERRVHMEQELRGAWERGELSLAYQPVCRASDGRVVGAEALLRWQHPMLGMISPSVFIDVAEQSGLIDGIGLRVLQSACAEAMRWSTIGEGGERLFVSVNVSPRQLRKGDLPDIVAECLRESGLPASCLHLELTETAVISDELQAATMLARLHATGVKVWLDDFGTGFSGLSHLRRVPVDGVKIDR